MLEAVKASLQHAKTCADRLKQADVELASQLLDGRSLLLPHRSAHGKRASTPKASLEREAQALRNGRRKLQQHLKALQALTLELLKLLEVLNLQSSKQNDLEPSNNIPMPSEVRDVFASFDRNGDGALCVRELRGALRELAVSAS
eukprot:2186560-Pleurochrysis_carterae.AAC.1